MNTELTQAAYDEAAHERLAEIRKITGCGIGQEATAVRALCECRSQYREALRNVRAEIEEVQAFLTLAGM